MSVVTASISVLDAGSSPAISTSGRRLVLASAFFFVHFYMELDLQCNRSSISAVTVLCYISSPDPSG